MVHPYHSTVRSAGNHLGVVRPIWSVRRAFEESSVSIDEQHIALPKLYGAPAYARPPRPATGIERPFDPDELPLEAQRTEDEQEFVEMLPARADAPGGSDLGHNGHGDSGRDHGLQPRSFDLRVIAGRLLGGD
jgi:hypothetical protein